MNLTANDKTGLLMEEDKFWLIIDKAQNTSGGNYKEEIVALRNVLFTLESSEIEKFDNTFTALLAASYDWKL